MAGGTILAEFEGWYSSGINGVMPSGEPRRASAESKASRESDSLSNRASGVMADGGRGDMCRALALTRVVAADCGGSVPVCRESMIRKAASDR